MRRIRTTITGLVVSIALLAGAAGAVLAATSTAAPARTMAVSAVEYA